MSYFIVTNKGKSVKIDLNRSPVNALNYDLLSELNIILDEIESNCDINILILSGGDSKFFSFGLDIPEILLLTRSQVKETLNLLVNTCKKYIYLQKLQYQKSMVMQLAVDVC